MGLVFEEVDESNMGKKQEQLEHPFFSRVSDRTPISLSPRSKRLKEMKDSGDGNAPPAAAKSLAEPPAPSSGSSKPLISASATPQAANERKVDTMARFSEASVAGIFLFVC